MPQPGATPFIAGPFAQRVLGLGAYGFLNDLLYFELSGYRPLSTNTQLALGVDTTGQSPISGIAAPYWRGGDGTGWGGPPPRERTLAAQIKAAPHRRAAATPAPSPATRVDTPQSATTAPP